MHTQDTGQRQLHLITQGNTAASHSRRRPSQGPCLIQKRRPKIVASCSKTQAKLRVASQSRRRPSHGSCLIQRRRQRQPRLVQRHKPSQGLRPSQDACQVKGRISFKMHVKSRAASRSRRRPDRDASNTGKVEASRAPEPRSWMLESCQSARATIGHVSAALKCQNHNWVRQSCVKVTESRLGASKSSSQSTDMSEPHHVKKWAIGPHIVGTHHEQIGHIQSKMAASPIKRLWFAYFDLQIWEWFKRENWNPQSSL